MKDSAGVTIYHLDILAIHRIPRRQGKVRPLRPVIVNFDNSEVKVKIIKIRFLGWLAVFDSHFLGTEDVEKNLMLVISSK